MHSKNQSFPSHWLCQYSWICTGRSVASVCSSCSSNIWLATVEELLLSEYTFCIRRLSWDTSQTPGRWLQLARHASLGARLLLRLLVLSGLCCPVVLPT